ncbi:MAG: TIGR00730 family Rossman fold protein [Tannerella sp.]|nr:TIGR00730 family Rossman fold protein [Tannerella sp.]
MIQSVCVYCASSADIDIAYTEDARELGRLLGQRGLRVVNGAGNAGLMRVVSDATLEAGGVVTGVIPRFMVERSWCHPSLTELIQTETMHERKQLMAKLSDAAVALPGGYGTLEELLEVITWKQLGLYQKPLVVLNTNNYYDPLLEMFHRAETDNFIREKHLRLWQIAQTPEEAVQKIFQSGV